MAVGLYEIQIFGLYPILIFMLLFLGYRILSRNRANINVIFALFFLVSGGSLVINLIYAIQVGDAYLISDDATYTFLNNLINVTVGASWIFLYCFLMIVKKSEAEFTKKKQFLLIVAFWALMMVLLFIPGGVEAKAYDLTNDVARRPMWSLLYFGYGLALNLIVGIACIVQGFLVYKKFQDPVVKKKFLFFIVGLILILFMIMNNYFANAEILGEAYRDVGSYLMLLIIPANIFLYYGVGKRID